MACLGLLLLGLCFSPQAALAQACAGTTVSGTVVDNADSVSCTGGTTVIDFSGSAGGTALEASGTGPVVLNNDGSISGNTFDLSSLTQGYIINNNGGLNPNFNSTFNLGPGEITNAGTIRLGRSSVLSAPGTSFAGTGDSLLSLTATILDGTGRAGCTANVTIVGCLDLTGGETSGQTGILITTSNNPNNPFLDPIDTPVNSGVVVVDVRGGSSHASHFMLDPTSDNYAEDPKYGPIIATGGLFDYTLLYNPNNQQHVLSSVPQREGVEYVSFIQQGLSIWHTTSDAVAGRQADLQNGGQRGGWIRIVNEQTERDAMPTMTTHGNSFTYDNDYKLNTKSLIAGYDLTAADNHVIGAHMGIVAARQDYRSDSSSRDETRGATFGAYAGWWNDAGLTLDGTLNANMLTIDHKPGRDLETSESNVRSFGLRAEAGWRFPLAETLYVQPLATAAYMRANIENLELRDNKADFENADSQRAALGVRLGGDMDLTGDRYSRLKYWLTARAWEEFAGDDAQVQFKTDGDPLVIEDDLSGSFEEVGLGASLTNAAGDISVFLSGNFRSGDDTDSSNVTIGARMNW